MTKITLALGACISLALAQAQADELAYVGTRGVLASEQPQSEVEHGIHAVRLDSKTGRVTSLGLQVALDRATWLIGHPTLPILYATTGVGHGPTGQSLVMSFALDRTSGKLTPLDKVNSGGVGPTHMALDVTSGTMFVAHFGGGEVTALPVWNDGRLGDVVSIQKQYGTGPHRRQSSPHAHGIAVAPSHRHVIATDFGADRIFIYRIDAGKSLLPAEPAFESVPAGAGPRHVLFDRTGKFVYVNTELSAEVRVYRWQEKQQRLRLTQSLSAYPEGYSGEQKSSAEIAMSRDGRFVYVSLRGDQDSIVVFAVNERSGTLKKIQRIPVQGKAPWSFAVDPAGRWMLVVNESSNSVSVLGLDADTGLLRPTGESVSIPRPVSIAFDRG